MTGATHQGIRQAIRNRIVAGEWKLGERIPGESVFAEEYACSRTTVNRALRALAEEGIVERKRKGGTRVLPVPLPRAQFRIPIVRQQVEELGQIYTHELVRRELCIPAKPIRERLGFAAEGACDYLESRHLADGLPFAVEQRWVNPLVVPDVRTAEFDDLSVNEWLVTTVPFSHGNVRLTATGANARIAEMLSVEHAAAVFTIERTTWFDERWVTAVTTCFAPGYKVEFGI